MTKEIQRGLPGLADDRELDPAAKRSITKADEAAIDWPAWYTPSRERKRANAQVASGRHPFGLQLGPPESTCGSCDHAYRVSWRTRSFWKCRYVKETRGPGSDLRKRWRGCERFQSA